MIHEPGQAIIKYTYGTTGGAKGNVVKVKQGAREIDFVYDTAGRLQKVIDPLEVETVLAYDPAERVAAVTMPGPATLGLQYDDEDRLTQLQLPVDSGSKNHDSRYGPRGLEDNYTPPTTGSFDPATDSRMPRKSAGIRTRMPSTPTVTRSRTRTSWHPTASTRTATASSTRATWTATATGCRMRLRRATTM